MTILFIVARQLVVRNKSVQGIVAAHVPGSGQLLSFNLNPADAA
jgi:hypothetical protein